MNKIPKLTLIGAGPGDPELISLKGIKALATADVVLYDALINKSLLQHVPASVEKIYVGKRAGKHSYSQEGINKLIIENAFKYGHVIRLKGGDPFVFGRGYEELEYAETFGIETSVIPGISSATAISGLQKIPLTSRNISESFWVITGTTKSGKVSNDVYWAAQSSATVVILMGMKNLGAIMKIFSRYGRGYTPIAIIQNGSLPNERIETTIVNNAKEMARQLNLKSPSIIVIGEVVKLHPQFKNESVVSVFSKN